MSTGELITRWTVRLALACYFLAVGMRLTGRGAARRTAIACGIYTAGCLLFLIHVAAAFEVFHHWSHRDALEETARQTQELTGIRAGIGLWLNYLFTLLWCVDVGCWWRTRNAPWPVSRRTLALHAFMLFMIFNATAIFETGAIRWLGALGCGVIIALFLRREVFATSRLR